MERWISGRFGAGGAVPDAGDRSEIALMARVGAYLYAAGATLALVWLAFPHPRGSDDAILFAIVGAAFAGAAALRVRGDRLPGGAFELVVAAGTVLISAAIHFSGRSGTPFVLFYLWSNLYAWYFFSRRRAIVQLAWIGVAYALVLIVRDPITPVANTGGVVPFVGPGAARWLITIGTMLVAGALVAMLR